MGNGPINTCNDLCKCSSTEFIEHLHRNDINPFGYSIPCTTHHTCNMCTMSVIVIRCSSSCDGVKSGPDSSNKLIVVRLNSGIKNVSIYGRTRCFISKRTAEWSGLLVYPVQSPRSCELGSTYFHHLILFNVFDIGILAHFFQILWCQLYGESFNCMLENQILVGR